MWSGVRSARPVIANLLNSRVVPGRGDDRQAARRAGEARVGGAESARREQAAPSAGTREGSRAAGKIVRRRAGQEARGRARRGGTRASASGGRAWERRGQGAADRKSVV